MARKKDKLSQIAANDATALAIAHAAQANKSEPDLNEPAFAHFMLKRSHPNNCYWRCGFAFHKDVSTQVALSGLSDEQIQRLNDDPWLQRVLTSE